MVTSLEEKTFTDPSLTRNDMGVLTRSTTLQLTPYQLEDYKEYKRDLKKYREDKARVFIVIYGQCTKAVQEKLRASYDLTKMEKGRDVVELLKSLKTMAFTPSNVQDVAITMCEGLRRLASLNQGVNESVIHYKLRFLAAAEVLDQQWGGFFPPAWVQGSETKEQAKNRLLARLLLTGADKKRFGTLLDEQNNAYLAGKKDGYPQSIDATVDLLSHYQNGGVQMSSATTRPSRLEAGFAQGGVSSKIQCYKCKAFGHRKSECPELTKPVTNQVESDQGLVKAWNSLQF